MRDPVAEFRERFFDEGGPGRRAEVQRALALARVILACHVDSGRACFRTLAECDAALRAEGLRLVENEPFGPPSPDARQLIYASADRRVIVKVKTKGYADGRRAGGTMSIEIGNGNGVGLQDVYCKVDRAGQPIPSNVITPDQLHRTADGLCVRRSSGRLEQVMAHEIVLEDARGFDADAFADRGHFDLAPGFDPTGAEGLRPK